MINFKKQEILNTTIALSIFLGVLFFFLRVAGADEVAVSGETVVGENTIFSLHYENFTSKEDALAYAKANGLENNISWSQDGTFKVFDYMPTWTLSRSWSR